MSIYIHPLRFSQTPASLLTHRSSSVLVADLGRLEIKSDLQANVPDVRVKTLDLTYNICTCVNLFTRSGGY